MYLLLYLLIIYLIINYFQNTKRYYDFYPTIEIYPDNNKELDIVKKFVDKRHNNTIFGKNIFAQFFRKTDRSIAYAFLPYVTESLEYLNNMIDHTFLEIYLLKIFFNRIRPFQLDRYLNSLGKCNLQSLNNLPSYPSGHAYQAYFLSKQLTKKYPNKKKLFDFIAYKCDLIRVYGGVNYPSDGKLAKSLVNLFY